MSTSDEFAFYAIAEPLVNLGIRVFPIQPGGKMPPYGMKFLEEATTDLGQIGSWHLQHRDYNVAMLADPVCFLEFDVPNGVEAMCEEMGQDTPDTRMQRSGSGGSHMIFVHTDRSRALGNRSVNRDGHEWFSFRAMNKYLIGAGSLHPNGNRYKLVSDITPTPIPHWVLDFVEKHSTPEKGGQVRTGKSGGDWPILDDDFDFDDFCEYFGLDGDQDGDWYITEECPIAGHRHKQSLRTGFWFDGEHLGWKCFAQGCEGSGMTIKDVILFLEEEKGEKYPHRIWAPMELTGEDYAAWGLSWEQMEADSNAYVEHKLTEVEETRLKNFDWSRFEALHEEALKETGEFKFDAETWDTINRTDWSQVPTDPEAWGVPEDDVDTAWFQRFVPDTDKPYSDDIKVLAADLGADTMYFLARTRQCPGFIEPSPHILTFEEMKRMAEARISTGAISPDGWPSTVLD